MNGKHTEFLAYHRVAEFRREASRDRRPVDAGPDRASWRARTGSLSLRTLGRIRLVLRHDNVNA